MHMYVFFGRVDSKPLPVYGTAQLVVNLISKIRTFRQVQAHCSGVSAARTETVEGPISLSDSLPLYYVARYEQKKH
jgi:hypothetical protein